MAIEDIVQGPGFVDVYPVSTQNIKVDRVGISWQRNAGGGSPVWPPLANEGRGDGTLGLVVSFVHFQPTYDSGQNPASDHYYIENADTRRYWSSGGRIDFNTIKTLTSTFTENFNSIIYFDLAGLPRGAVTRAELVITFNRLSCFFEDDFALVGDYHDSYGTYTAGDNELVMVEDDYSVIAPAGGIFPAVSFDAIMSGPPIYPDRFPVADPFDAYPEEDYPRWALPLVNDGGFQSGRLRGIRLHINGGDPTGYNEVVTAYDAMGGYESVHESGFLQGDAYGTPHLRLWFGLEAAADVTLNLTLEARVENPLRRITEHRARQRRGW